MTGIWKKAGAAILFADKMDVKLTLIEREKEDHYILVKRTIQEEEMTIINI